MQAKWEVVIFNSAVNSIIIFSMELHTNFTNFTFGFLALYKMSPMLSILQNVEEIR